MKGKILKKITAPSLIMIPFHFRAGELLQKPYAVIDAELVGEGGLMGLAIHPSFPAEPYVYVMHTY